MLRSILINAAPDHQPPQRPQYRVTFTTDLPDGSTYAENTHIDELDPCRRPETICDKPQSVTRSLPGLTINMPGPPSSVTTSSFLKNAAVEPNDEQNFPLSYHNTSLSPYGHCSSIRPEQIDPLAGLASDPEWYTHCSFDNIAHDRPTPEEVASSSNSCYCYARQHGIILRNKTLTHGEGAPQSSMHEDPVCVICFKQLFYSSERTLTHRVPYYAGPVYDPKLRISSHCGAMCHVECASKHVKHNIKLSHGTTVPCPGGCGNDWIVDLDTKTRAGLLLRNAANNFKKSLNY